MISWKVPPATVNTEFVDMDNYLNKIWINVENSCFIHKPKIKNSKIVRAIKYAFKIRVVLQYPALPEGREENL